MTAPLADAPAPIPLVDVEWIAKRLGRKTWWVYDQVSRGLLPAHRIGGLWRFDLGEIDRWIEERRVGPKVPEGAR